MSECYNVAEAECIPTNTAPARTGAPSSQLMINNLPEPMANMALYDLVMIEMSQNIIDFYGSVYCQQ